MNNIPRYWLNPRPNHPRRNGRGLGGNRRRENVDFVGRTNFKIAEGRNRLTAAEDYLDRKLPNWIEIERSVDKLLEGNQVRNIKKVFCEIGNIASNASMIGNYKYS